VFEQLLHCQKLLTAKELSGIVNIKAKTIYSYVEHGLIPHYKIESNVRFRGREIADWLRDRAGERYKWNQRAGYRETRQS
jgi:predicted DNA-binding transcriptional regulator AlpA